MYLIPKDFEVNGYQKSKIVQIGYTINTVNIFFDGMGFITLTHRFRLTIDGHEKEYSIYPVKNDFGLLTLLEKEITEVLIDSKRYNLTFKFLGGSVLEIVSTEEFESFTISRNKGEQIIV